MVSHSRGGINSRLNMTKPESTCLMTNTSLGCGVSFAAINSEIAGYSTQSFSRIQVFIFLTIAMGKALIHVLHV